MKTEYNFADDVAIDPDALDVEWLRNSTLYMKWAKLLADAKEKVRILDNELKLMDAQIYKDVRKDAVKITEKQIQAEVEMDGTHQEIVQEISNAIYDVDVCSAAVRAIDHKKSALENAVKLWGGAYFSGPKEPRNLKEEMDMKSQGADEVDKKLRADVKEKEEKKVKNKGEKKARQKVVRDKKLN